MSWFFCVYVLFFTFATSNSTLLDKLSKIKWNCADENCSVPISEGYGLRFYNGDDPLKLNFNENDQFLILGKSNDKFDNYWLVQAGDRKGIVPVQFVKERKVIINRVNQIVTELDLSSIIQPVNTEINVKESIKPSSPNVVIDGTTLPSYEEDSFSSEVVVEEDSEEVYEPSKLQVEENSFYAPFSGPSPIKSDSPETDPNPEANATETSEDFTSDKVVSIATGDVNTNETLNSQSAIENNTDIKNSTEAEAGQIQDFVNDKVEAHHVSNVTEDSIEVKTENVSVSEVLSEVETEHVGSVSGDSNNQNFFANSEINSVNDTETKQVLGSDVNVESTLNNVTDTLNDKTEESDEEKKANDLKVDKIDPESHLTDTQNVNIFSEPLSTIVPQQPDENNSTNADQLIVNEEENSTATVTVPNTDDFVTVLPTEIPVTSKEDSEKHSVPAEPNLPTVSETVSTAKEGEPVFQPETGLGIETHTPSPKLDLPSDLGPGKEDMTVPLSGMSNSHVETFSHSSGSLLSPFAQSFGNNEPSDSKVPPPTEFTTVQYNSNFNTDDSKPTEFSISSEPVSSMPVTEPPLHQDSPDISNTYTSSSNEFNHHDTGNPESLLTDSISNSQLEKTKEEGTAGSDSSPPVIDQHLLNNANLEEVVTENLPADHSVEESNDRKDNSGFVPQTDELADVIQDGDGWFSGISSVMSSFTEMFAKSDIGIDREDVLTAPEELVTSSGTSGSRQIDDDVNHCAKESCDEQLNDNKVYDNENKGSPYVSDMFGDFSESHMSFSTFLCMVITSIVVLLFSLGYYYLQNLKQDASLIAKINTVSTELFFAQKELASIEEQYQLANENYQRLVSETSHNETAIEELRKELEESKAARGILEEEIKRLEKEIESLVEEGDEMHRMLAESFSEEERTKSLLANISDLKGVLSDRLQEIVSLTEQLDKEKQEVELLTISLKKSEEKREATEDKLTKVLIDSDSKTLAVTKEFEEKITTLERIIEERSLERTNFEKQICELKGTCESLMVEKELAEKELKKAHGVGSGKALSEWLEAKNIKTDLLTVQKEVEKLTEALEEAKNRGAFLEEKERQLLSEIEDLNNKYESAEKDKIEALTKLQVLSNYFKEKEIQLQEELGIKESQWLQKQSEDHTIYEQMRSLREENLSYKAQNDALKKEIIDQEASFKIQIANEEQKAQENWINLRHTERRLKEVQMEAAHLRSRLTALEANPDSLEDKHKSLEMVNGDVSMGAASPPFMLYPPPDYIPPPPLVSPTRPPPLGRLSSPPLTPPAPLSPFEFYPPPPPSPPPPLRVHKPQPREPHRKQKDSQSSNHSSESTEKPIRRGKR